MESARSGDALQTLWRFRLRFRRQKNRNAAHLHVRWDGVRDDARVSVGVDDTDGGDVLGGAFPDGAEVLGRVEEDDQVGEVGFVGDGLDSEAEDVESV